MSRSKNKSEDAPAQATPDRVVVVDYNGFSGQAPRKRGQRAQPRVRHRQPRHFWAPVEGREAIMVYPGANVLDREVFEFWRDNDKAFAALMKRRVIKTLDALPDEESLIRESTGLIARTKSPAGLDWIERMEKAGENRDFVLEAIEARRPYAREYDVKFSPFASHRHGSFDATKERLGGREPNSPTAAF